VPYYILNSVTGEGAQRTALRERAAEFLRVGMWGIDADEPHRDALAAGDLVLIIWGHPSGNSLAVPSLLQQSMLGHRQRHGCTRATPRAESCWLRSTNGTPRVPMNIVLSHLDPAANARADFEAGVVRITAHEYETVLAVAAGRAPSSS